MGTPPQIEVGVLGWTDSLLLMVLALVVFGPRRLPQIGRQIGKLMYEFRKASNDFKFQMEEELRNAEEADRRKKEEERLRALAAQAPPAQMAPPMPADPTPDPYSQEALYPQGAPTAESPASAETEGTAPESPPRIQPPSTGEPVAAARPHRARGEIGSEIESAHDNGAGNPTGTVQDAADAAVTANETTPGHGEENAPVTEQTAQHG